MVTVAKRTSRPVTGCVQFFSASTRMAAFSSPRAGGALNSEPTTEKRNRAHKREVDGSCFRVITAPHKQGESHCESHRLVAQDGRRCIFCGPVKIIARPRRL